jgi:hypothetical protein
MAESSFFFLQQQRNVQSFRIIRREGVRGWVGLHYVNKVSFGRKLEKEIICGLSALLY